MDEMPQAGDSPRPMPPRQAITCPQCGRTLTVLRRPQCLWCGAPIPDADFRLLAAQSQRVWERPDPPPLPQLSPRPLSGGARWARGPVRLSDLRPRNDMRPRVAGRWDRQFFRSFGGWVVAVLLVYQAVRLLHVFWLLHRVLISALH